MNDQTIRDVAGTPGYQAWFATRSHWYGDEFGAVIERAMSQSSGFDTRFVGEDTQASPQERGTAATEA